VIAEFPFGGEAWADLDMVLPQEPEVEPPTGQRQPILEPLRASTIIHGRRGAYRLMIIRDYPVRFS
jgi:hypothetical protein